MRTKKTVTEEFLSLSSTNSITSNYAPLLLLILPSPFCTTSFKTKSSEVSSTSNYRIPIDTTIDSSTSIKVKIPEISSSPNYRPTIITTTSSTLSSNLHPSFDYNLSIASTILIKFPISNVHLTFEPETRTADHTSTTSNEASTLTSKTLDDDFTVTEHIFFSTPSSLINKYQKILLSL